METTASTNTNRKIEVYQDNMSYYSDGVEVKKPEVYSKEHLDVENAAPKHQGVPSSVIFNSRKYIRPHILDILDNVESMVINKVSDTFDSRTKFRVNDKLTGKMVLAVSEVCDSHSCSEFLEKRLPEYAPFTVIFTTNGNAAGNLARMRGNSSRFASDSDGKKNATATEGHEKAARDHVTNYVSPDTKESKHTYDTDTDRYKTPDCKENCKSRHASKDKQGSIPKALAPTESMVVIKVNRPLRIWPHLFTPCCCDYCRNMITIESPPGHYMKIVREQFGMLHTSYEIMDEDSIKQLDIVGPFEVWPFHINRDQVEFKIVNHGNTLGTLIIRNMYKKNTIELNIVGVVSTNNKAAILCAAILIHFTFYARTRKLLLL